MCFNDQIEYILKMNSVIVSSSKPTVMHTLYFNYMNRNFLYNHFGSKEYMYIMPLFL